MDKDTLKGIIESLLFAWGDPLAEKDLSKILNIHISELQKIIAEMNVEMEKSNRGLTIKKVDDTFQLGTKLEYFEYIKLLKEPNIENSISSQALETLTIIAYKQPVIKSEIDNIRGVKSDRALQTLLEKNLIKEIGRLEKIGRPILYGTTIDFLRAFGLEKLDDLPKIDLKFEKDGE